MFEQSQRTPGILGVDLRILVTLICRHRRVNDGHAKANLDQRQKSLDFCFI